MLLLNRYSAYEENVVLEREANQNDSLEILMRNYGQKTKDALATNDKYWKSPCNVTNKDALSAISRAKTEKCKREISSISCMIGENILFPDFIQK